MALLDRVLHKTIGTAPGCSRRGNVEELGFLPRSASFPRRLQFLELGLFSALLPWVVLDVPAQTAAPKEYQIKAGYLFKFAQFVEWPTNSFPDAGTPLVIGILGKDPFGPYLDEMVRGEKVNNRPLVIERYRRVEEIEACHVLFISQAEAGRLETIVAGLRGRSILTVSDTEKFAALGGMVRLVTEKNRIRMKINLAAAKAANLTISSKLLRPAEIVTSEKD